MTPIWYALRTFNCQEQKVSAFLTDNQLVNFIPMTYIRNVEEKPVLVPAVHNLLFVRKTITEKSMLSLLGECPVPVRIFRHTDTAKICEITDCDMTEFRMLCDPDYENTVYLPQDGAEVMVGKEVRIINGPFKGSTGRLVRKHKQFYFLKAVIGMGVMVRVSRWYCEAL